MMSRFSSESNSSERGGTVERLILMA